MYYLKMSYRDTEKLPLKLRDWFVSRLVEQLRREKEELDGRK